MIVYEFYRADSIGGQKFNVYRRAFVLIVLLAARSATNAVLFAEFSQSLNVDA